MWPKIALYCNREVTVSIAGLVVEILIDFCPAQWSRGIRSRCAAARLLGLRVRIPPGVRTSVSWACCLLSSRGLASGWSLVQRSPRACDIPECDREASIMSLWTTRGSYAFGGRGFSVLMLMYYLKEPTYTLIMSGQFILYEKTLGRVTVSSKICLTCEGVWCLS
jgi:hypothetical protein